MAPDNDPTEALTELLSNLMDKGASALAEDIRVGEGTFVQSVLDILEVELPDSRPCMT